MGQYLNRFMGQDDEDRRESVDEVIKVKPPEQTATKTTKDPAKVGCPVRRQVRLCIDADLMMTLPLDDTCVACVISRMLILWPDEKHIAQVHAQRQILHNQRLQFIQEYQSLSMEDLSTALVVSPNDLKVSMLKEVSCVECRKLIKDLLADARSGVCPLAPLLMNPDGSISVRSDHLRLPEAMGNLFFFELPRMQSMYEQEPTNSKKQKKKYKYKFRCAVHSFPSCMEQIICDFDGWSDTWQRMTIDWRFKVGIISFQSLRSLLDARVQNFRLCSKSTALVDQAFRMLFKMAPDAPIEAKCDSVMECCESRSTAGIIHSDDTYKGLILCPAKQHVQVDGTDETFMLDLINTAARELFIMGSGQRLELINCTGAKKLVMTCIGSFMAERILRIQQKMEKGRLAANQLLIVALKCMKKAFYLTLQSKQHITDPDNQCEEVEQSTETKVTQKKRCKDQVEEKPAEDPPPESPTTTSASNVSCDLPKDPSNADCNPQPDLKAAELPSDPAHESPEVAPIVPVSRINSLTLSLEEMLEGGDQSDQGVSSEDIQQFYLMNPDLGRQREELRKQLRIKFNNFCSNNSYKL